MTKLSLYTTLETPTLISKSEHPHCTASITVPRLTERECSIGRFELVDQVNVEGVQLVLADVRQVVQLVQPRL